jgi:hypothetical protein
MLSQPPGSTRRTGRPAHRGNCAPTSRDTSSEVIAVRSTDGIIPQGPAGATHISGQCMGTSTLLITYTVALAVWMLPQITFALPIS